MRIETRGVSEKDEKPHAVGERQLNYFINAENNIPLLVMGMKHVHLPLPFLYCFLKRKESFSFFMKFINLLFILNYENKKVVSHLFIFFVKVLWSSTFS